MMLKRKCGEKVYYPTRETALRAVRALTRRNPYAEYRVWQCRPHWHIRQEEKI